MAILGSQGSFIGVAVIDTIHELQVPWFALSVGGVGIIENKRTPNWATVLEVERVFGLENGLFSGL